ncbi:hypothetical protein J5N97_002705 [Dioscorea zingiberensis]|uniref:Uncharacterized protein n=1 Tax=Dioscorea zingiberensis TaxID=325984 RepID=A0A9D5HPN4_9LILI|nr:hypothetical protein J5N97_002705 [Dioscorea zingiberensis]
MMVDQYIHRILVEEDADSAKEHVDNLWDAASDAGEKLYTKGDFPESGITDLDVYLLKKLLRFLVRSRRPSDAAVAHIGELGLDPLDAAPERGLELAFHGEHVIRGDPALPLELRVAGAREAVTLAAWPVEAVGFGALLVAEPAGIGR